jgi:hypothetical protein
MAFKFLSGYISKVLNQGWRNNVDWPTDPVDEAAARERLQIQHDQTRDYINDYLNYLDDTGAADAYVITLDPAPTSYPLMIQFKAAHANTGASNIKPNALDAVAIKKNVSSDLAAGDIPEGGIACLVFDGTFYQLINVAGSNAYMPTAGGTFTGPVIYGRQEARQPQIKDYSEVLSTNAAATGAVTLDIVNGNVFNITLTGDTTFTFSNPAPDGQACSFTLILNQGGTARTVTWPASVKWPNDSVPDISTINKTSILTFVTINGGTRWYGFLGGNKFVT